MRHCTVCTHPEREAIETALVGLEASLRTLGARFELTHSALHRHSEAHLPGTLLAKREAEVEAQGERVRLTADRVLRELSRLAFLDIRKLYNADGTLKTPQELDDDTAAALASLESHELGGGREGVARKLRLWNKLEALAMLSKHLGLYKEPAQVEVNLQTAPEWIEVRTALLQALLPYPDARAAVVAAMRRLAEAEAARSLTAPAAGYPMERLGG